MVSAMADETMNGAVSGEQAICKRCAENPSALVVRREPLCEQCFIKYIHTKVIKRMEGSRLQYSNPNETRKLLLPISLGASSLSLLHVLNSHLDGQLKRSGRASYRLHVLHVDTGVNATDSVRLFEQLKSLYPRHEYSTKTTIEALRTISIKTPSKDDSSDSETNGTPSSSPKTLATFIESTSSVTTQDVLFGLAKHRIASEAAKDFECEGILWGDTTTRLAEKILSETAKGRGGYLPRLVSDGLDLWGLMVFYPMRDLLKKEVNQFVRLSDLSGIISNPDKELGGVPVSARNASIDSVMSEYFGSIEESYPSIVANVVRTSTKLDRSSSEESHFACALCAMPNNTSSVTLNHESSQGSRSQGNALRDATKEQQENGSELCNACIHVIFRKVP